MLEAETGKERWRLKYKSAVAVLVPAAADLLVVGTESHLLAVAAETGTVRLSVRHSFGADELNRASIVCDGRRVYVAANNRVVAYSLHPLEPGKSDPADPADPRRAFAECRRALVDGDHRAALNALKGIGLWASNRPESREDAARLLSLLSRSAAAETYPEMWDDLMKSDGWLGGELFYANYERTLSNDPHRRSAAALFYCGTRRSLECLSKLLDRPEGAGSLQRYALDAAERLTGRRPLEKARLPKYAEWLDPLPGFDLPLNDATFSRLLPELRAADAGSRDDLMYVPTPRQLVQVVQNRGANPDCGFLLEVAQRQAAAEERGRGETEAIEIHFPPPKREEPKDEF
jgi:hypothetical protein